MLIEYSSMKDYDGSGFARRFFVNCEQEFKGLSTHSWIYAVEACFIGKAAEWVSQQSEIQDILDLEEPDEADKARFCHFIKQKYPDRKSPTHKQWMTQLKELKQNDESLGQYYRRTYEIFRGVGGQDKEEDDDDTVLSLSEITVLDHIIEKFVDGLNDRQFRCRMRYKYLVTSGRYLATSEWSFYGAYEAAEQISSYITSKKQALEDEFEQEVSTVMQAQGMAAALKFAMENQPEPYTRKSKSIFIDRIERYRPFQQHKKYESTMQKEVVKKGITEVTPASKLTQPYTDANSSDSNVSALDRISGGSQSTPHPDSAILENVMALSSQPQPNYDSVSYEQVIRSEKPAEREESDKDYASGSRKLPAPVTIPAVNESPLILEEVPCNLSEISTPVNITNIESLGRPTASEFTSMQKPSFETSTVYASPPLWEEMSCDLSEISTTIENISDIESMDEVFVSGSRKWAVGSTSLQKSSSEASIINESLPVLEQIPLEISETNATIMDISDTESKKDKVLAFEPSEWIITPNAGREVFDPVSTSIESSKNQPASHIKKDIEAEEVAESIVDMETLDQEVFALVALYDTFLKNSPALYSEDAEISTAVDRLSLEHLTNEDNSATGAFDSATEIVASSKNSSIQQTEHSEALEKDSAHIELPALFAFDLSIDIDFEVYTIDSVTYSSTQSPASPSSFSSSTPPVTLQVTEATSVYGREQIICFTNTSASTPLISPVAIQAVEETSDYGREQFSTCFADYATTSYEREQSSTCFADCMTSGYEGEQDTCFVDTISDVITKPGDITFTKSTITKSTVTTSNVTKFIVHHALLVYCLVWIKHTTLSFCMVMWITIYDYVALLGLTIEYKARPKVKIKRLLEAEHIDSRSSIAAGIFAEFTYKMALFSGSMEGLETFKDRGSRISIRFRLSGLQNSHLASYKCDEGKVLILWILGILRYLFYESHWFTHSTWSIWLKIQCQDCYAYRDLCYMLGDDLTRCCRGRQLVMKGSCWREGVRKWPGNETLGSIGLGPIGMT